MSADLSRGVLLPSVSNRGRLARFWPAMDIKNLPIESLRPSLRGWDGASHADRVALEHAYLLGQAPGVQCAVPGYTSSPSFPPPAATGWTAVANNAAETALISGNTQPILPAWQFDPNAGVNPQGRRATLDCAGVFSNTATPTLTFTVRLGSTAAVITGTTIAQSAAITTTSGVTNVGWRMVVELECYTTGQGSGNLKLLVHGWVESPAGFASPFKYFMTPSSAAPQTWSVSSSLDASVANFLQVSVTWGTASASNTIAMNSMYFVGWN